MFNKLRWISIPLGVLIASTTWAEQPADEAQESTPLSRFVRASWLQEQAGPEAPVQPDIEPELQAAPEETLPTQTQPVSLSDTSSLFDASLLDDIDFGSPVESKQTFIDQLPPERVAAVGGAIAGPSNVVLASEASVRATTDTGDLLGSSLANTGVYTRQESLIINQTRIRGYRYGQIRITNAGAAWFPIRPDFDTPLSRFDSSIVRDVVTVNGPYTVRNGPGLAFIDVALQDSPRYECCGQWEGYSKFLYNTNGDQWYGRQSFQGGGPNAGWRIGYGHAGAVDYEAGDGTLIGGSYKARDLDLAYGYDLSADSSLEFKYLRNDLTDVQLPGQVSDFEFLKSDGFDLKYVLENQERFDLFTMHGWYNQSSFAGTGRYKAPGGGNIFPPGGLPGLNDPAGTTTPPLPGDVILVTTGENSSAGFRGAMSWFGDDETEQLTVGTDYNVLRQDYRHGATGPDAAAIDFPNTDLGGAIDFGVPLAEQQDFGLFADTALHHGEYVTLRAGTRVDWIDSTATAVTTPRPTSPPDSVIDPGPNPDQSFALFAGYLTAEAALDPNWTGDVGVGYSERAPTPTELYAEMPFLNIVQQGGFFAPLGNNELKKEKLFQIDVGLTANYDDVQFGIRGYHGWVDDYITLRSNLINPPNPALPFTDPSFENTQARLWGGESFGNVQWTDRISMFGAISYTGGRDDTLNIPLWGIAPIDSTVGIRLEGLARCGRPKPWGLEYSVRMVDSQNRVSSGAGAVNAAFGLDPERITPSFTLHDIRGYYRLSRGVSLVGGVENLADELYREHLNSITNISQGERGADPGVASADLTGGVLGRGRNFYFGVQATY